MDASEPVLVSELASDPDVGALLDEFVDGLFLRIAHLRRLLAAGAYEELRRMAHQIKGAGGGYGYPSITEAGRALERLAVRRDDPALAEAVETLSQLANQARRGRIILPGARGPDARRI